jgi:hypothetical protein
VCRRHRTIPCHGTAQLVVIDGRVCAMPTTEHAPTCNDLHLMCEGDGEDQVCVWVGVCVRVYNQSVHTRITYILLIITLLQPIHISKVVVATKRSNSGGRGSRNGSSGVSRRRRSRTVRVCVLCVCFVCVFCVCVVLFIIFMCSYRMRHNNMKTLKTMMKDVKRMWCVCVYV